MKKVLPLNPMPDGTCRTIKYQYAKNSLANFVRSGTYAATGVIEICYEQSNRNREHSNDRGMEFSAER